MKEFFRNNIIKLFLAAGLILNISLFLFFYFSIKQSDIPIVLHYNVDWGVDYFGEVKNIFILPTVGLIILLTNNFLALKFWFRMKILSFFLLSVTMLSEIFLWLAGIALYIINS